ncbi:MAG TPA: FAD-dependent oxidoreductase, partial [Phycisphaerae bacterium]|nr:FAD-dependent oxidoreductase [Phycisphaerae bacterium]
MRAYDVIVLGVGGMGSAACEQLARRGQNVLGIEQFHPGHDRGSSHGRTRIIRKAYFEHPDYVPLLHEAYRLWRELESDTGRRLYEPVGLLLAGRPEGA